MKAQAIRPVFLLAAAGALLNRLLLGAALLLTALMLAVFIIQNWELGLFDFDIRATAFYHNVLQVAAFLFFLNMAALAWRFYLFITYKPVPACPDPDLPAVTILVPAYNEGPQVAVTLKSICASDYPAEKMQVIAIDDGSKDDTWQWMEKAKAELGDRIEIIKQPKNGGKRHALYAGFQKARGQVWVTIDSDSVVEPWGLRNLVSPFVLDAHVGGVGGNVRVLNYQEGFIPKLLEIAFTFGFDFVRSSHSRVNTVMCTPGALSAYRASAVRPVLEEWVNESFLGKPYNIGEDRNLTNLVLRQGYHVVFQSNANVFTNVPVTYKSLCKMLLRWARSDVRESIMLSGFAFKKFRPTSALGARINLLLSWVDMLVTQPLLLFYLLCLLLMPFVNVYITLLMTVIFGGIVPCAVYFWRHRNLRCLWGFPYALFYFVALTWVQVYANFTVHRSGWLTRQLPMEAGRRSAWRRAPIYGLATAAALLVINGLPSSHYQAPPINHDSRLVAMVPAVHSAEAVTVQDRQWWYLLAETNLGADDGQRLALRGAELVFNFGDGSVLRVQGEEALYDPESGNIVMRGSVQGMGGNGVLFVASNEVSFSASELTVDSAGEVLVKGPALDIKGKGMRFDLAHNRAYFTPQDDLRVSPHQSAGRVLATLGALNN
jgi:hyaluronan synthase